MAIHQMALARARVTGARPPWPGFVRKVYAAV